MHHYEGPERRSRVELTENEIKDIVRLVLKELYAEAGRNLIQKAVLITGMGFIAFLMYLGAKGIKP